MEVSGILLVMSGEHDNLIEAIQASGYKACIVVTGGGVGAIHALLSHPGASRFVLDVRIPYNSEALSEYLGTTPVSACSEETARQLALAALDRASHLADSASRVVGIACTAALQTTRERRGADRAFICIKSGRKELARKLEILPGSRSEQEAELSEAFLNLMSEFLVEESV